jgi:hypothetical protein
MGPVNDGDWVVLLDEYRHLTLQQVIRKWAGIVRGPDWCPVDEDDTAKLASVPGAAADALDGTLIVSNFKRVQRRVPSEDGPEDCPVRRRRTRRSAPRPYPAWAPLIDLVCRLSVSLRVTAARRHAV